MTSADVRKKLVEALVLDLVGPINDPARAHEQLDQGPSRWYLTGFLVPRERAVNRPTTQDDDDDEPDDDNLFAGEDDPVDDPTAAAQLDDDSDRAPEVVATKRQMLPSSIGLSVLVPTGCPQIEVTVRWGDYRPEMAAEGNRATAEEQEPFQLGDGAPGIQVRRRRHRRAVSSWSREPFSRTLTLPLTEKFTRPKPVRIPGSNGLNLFWLARPAPQEALDAALAPNGALTVNVYLVNDREPLSGPLRDQQSVFQAEFSLKCEQGFVPRPNLSGLKSSDDDDRLADLQYAGVYEYAVGHNVSAVFAPDAAGACHEVRTTWVPQAQVERVEAETLQGVELGMEALAGLATAQAARAALIELVTQYRRWIQEQAKLQASLSLPRRAEMCQALVNRAGIAADRMERGIEALEDPKVFRAFTLANAAMAMQARRREATLQGKAPADVAAPAWRPFQLAFFLLNLPGIVDPGSPDRSTVDLLFFPTGGGKTEAYLGLAAFTMLYRRFREGVGGVIPRYAGVTVLMRYTLRLLTLDQLGRATALVCALELLRQKNPAELGTWPFEVGLWVGSRATPNRMGKPGDEHGVVYRVLEYKQGRTKRAPVPLEKCPWCGAKLQPNSFYLEPNQSNAEELRISCLGANCEFTADRPLPVQMVDETIYKRLPAFLIATVDKFAGMPWVGDVAKLFGRVTSFERNKGFLGTCDSKTAVEMDNPLPPPELIIQDELHLISGPLGTIAGLFEVAIEHLCANARGQGPKIISSTATVRRASKQIAGLFGRSSVEIFPPPGPNRADSFFARTVPAVSQPPRLYLGVAAQGRSGKRALLKTYIALMSAAQKLFDKAGGAANPANPVDPYMTMLGYFNSLRELGGTRRLIEDELASRLGQYGNRRRFEGTASPFVDRRISRDLHELTSRYGTDQVNAAKDALSLPFGTEGNVDVALATNMISVGLDISRLGLMAVYAQPKTAAEYIQATSRVGRQKDKPGLILTIFSINRPRDRSHYERFQFFHETFYRSVEATSVTPFAPRALDRALFAVSAALARLGHGGMMRDRDAQAIQRFSQELDFVPRAIAMRALKLGEAQPQNLPLEQTEIYQRVRKLLDLWVQYADELSNAQVSLTYRSVKPAPARKLLHDLLDPELLALSRERRQFKAPWSMRDVEASVNILPHEFWNRDALVKVKEAKTTQSALRQSQLLTTYGPGAMIDLPWFAAVIGGLDYWPKGPRISEPRLEEKIRSTLGRNEPVELIAPRPAEGASDFTKRPEGVDVWRFPSWSVTREARTLQEADGSTYSSRLMVQLAALDLKTGRYSGSGFGGDVPAGGHSVVPIRFIRACKNGHMGDIDWQLYVHGPDVLCGQSLWLDDRGTTGELTELRIRCECGASRPLSEAAGKNNPALGHCDGQEWWLGPGARHSRCDQGNRLLIRTASNAYFPQRLSVISLPDETQTLYQAVATLWESHLKIIKSESLLQTFRGLPDVQAALAPFSDADVMQAINDRHAGLDGPPERKIKEAEFALLTCGRPLIGNTEPDSTFHAEELDRSTWDADCTQKIERVLVIHRLREVSALLTYTRFDFISPDIDGEFDLEPARGRLGLNTHWLPALENKGEGLFIQFKREEVERWLANPQVQDRTRKLMNGLAKWNEEQEKSREFFGAPFYMLHSLSHLLIHAISLECGYPASSIRERIYANPSMGYGILLYTASSDAQGTLGGLANAARNLASFLKTALEMGQLCSNDPVCSHHHADDPQIRRFLHGAACHGCLLISETSCEMFNELLDRSLVVPTVEGHGAEFFENPLA